MWLRKFQGGTAIGPYSWPEDGSVCEVPDQLGMELIGLGGYEKADAPEPDPASPPDKPAARKTPARTQSAKE